MTGPNRRFGVVGVVALLGMCLLLVGCGGYTAEQMKDDMFVQFDEVLAITKSVKSKDDLNRAMADMDKVAADIAQIAERAQASSIERSDLDAFDDELNAYADAWSKNLMAEMLRISQLEDVSMQDAQALFQKFTDAMEDAQWDVGR